MCAVKVHPGLKIYNLALNDFVNNGPRSQMEKLPRPALFDFHGVSMTRYFTDNWDNVQNFQARPDDILVATYPKAGGLRWGSTGVDH